MVIFIEFFCLRNFIIIFFDLLKKKKIYSKFNQYYYIDSSILGKYIIFFLRVFFSLNIKELKFKYVDLKDSNNESIRLRLNRKDFFEFQNLVINDDIFFKLHPNINNYYLDYFKLSLIDGHLIMEPDSIYRGLFIINVVKYFIEKNNIKNNIFFIVQKSWMSSILDYAKQFNINLSPIPVSSKFKRKYPLAYKLKIQFPSLMYFKSMFKYLIKFQNPFTKEKKKKIFLEPIEFFYLKNDGSKSDFFINNNSNLSFDDIFYPYGNESKKRSLEKYYNIDINNKVKFINPFSSVVNHSKPMKIYNHKDEYIYCEKLSKQYYVTKNYWEKYFSANNISVYFSYNKYDKNHIAKSEAMKNIGGTSALFQYAYEGIKQPSCEVYSDIYFNYSNNLLFKNLSYSDYNISVGYIMDYAFDLLKKDAKKLRDSLRQNGAKKIIAVFDENSKDDTRWHSGHELQRDNYFYILEKVLSENYLGVIFKPKVPRTIRQRLGKVNDLLNEAMKTGRCHILGDEGESYNHSIIHPVFAGLASDVAVHGHLCGGTAGVECALANIPTLLIDREGDPFNKLNNKLYGKNIVFTNWKDAINFIIEDFKTIKKNSKFGMWPSDFLNEIDQFRDGKAAFRMGNYLMSIIEGFNSGLKRDDVLNMAAEKYIGMYGKDKVL